MANRASPISSYPSSMMQTFSSGISYLDNRRVYLLGGVAVLVCALAILMVPSWLSAEEKPNEKSPNIDRADEKTQKVCQLANGRIVSQQTFLDEKSILKFLTDPRASQLIWEGRRKKHEFASTLYPEVQQFGQTYPDCPEVQEFVKKFKVYCHPLPYEGVWIPFLCLGAINTSDVDDPATVKTIQSFQIRIFKYWLSLYRLGKRDEQLVHDLLSFCKTSTLDVFFKIIGPMLEARLEPKDEDGDTHFDYEDIIFFFIDPDCYVDGRWSPDEESSSDEDEQVSAIGSLIDREAIRRHVAQSLKNVVFVQESEKTPGEKLVEEFESRLKAKYSHDQVDKNVSRDHFSKDAILGLFLEVTES